MIGGVERSGILLSSVWWGRRREGRGDSCIFDTQRRWIDRGNDRAAIKFTRWAVNASNLNSGAINLTRFIRSGPGATASGLFADPRRGIVYICINLFWELINRLPRFPFRGRFRMWYSILIGNRHGGVASYCVDISMDRDLGLEIVKGGVVFLISLYVCMFIEIHWIIVLNCIKKGHYVSELWYFIVYIYFMRIGQCLLSIINNCISIILLLLLLKLRIMFRNTLIIYFYNNRYK